MKSYHTGCSPHPFHLLQEKRRKKATSGPFPQISTFWHPPLTIQAGRAAGSQTPAWVLLGCSIRIIQQRLASCPELAAPLPQGKAEQPRVLLTLTGISRAESHEAGPYLLLEPAHGFLLPDPVLGSDVAGSALLVSDAETGPAQHLPGEQRHRVILALICFINTNSARKEAQSSQTCNVSLSGSCSGHKASSSPPPT